MKLIPDGDLYRALFWATLVTGSLILLMFTVSMISALVGIAALALVLFVLFIIGKRIWRRLVHGG